jgi:hypothetical protein
LDSAWDGLVASFYARINDLLSGIRGMLGISSPSDVFAGIGQNMIAGLEGGLQLATSGLTGSLGGGGAADKDNKTAGRSPTPVINYITIQAEVNSEIDYYRLAQQVGDEFMRYRP